MKKTIIRALLLGFIALQTLALSGCIPLLISGAAGGAAGYYIGKDKDKDQ